ncbi:hypothetical protein [Mycoplasma sp. ATU-Cv-508]|uniref:hypothetical protein n=1 Tax=Mycoplasma sp. ATU-Cv-508 TaxID=2048001 RepID=UPI000FDD667D
MPGFVFKEFAPKIDSYSFSEKIGWYEVSLDTSKYYRYSDNRASEWWLTKEEPQTIKPDTPYELNVKVSGQVNVGGGVRLEFLTDVDFETRFGRFGVGLQYQVAGRSWQRITPKREGKTHFANVTFNPIADKDEINFRIIPIRNVWWDLELATYQDYNLYYQVSRVSLHTAQDPNGSSTFNRPRVYTLKNVLQQLQQKVEIPSGDLKVKFTGRTHDAGSSGFSFVSATFDGVDWKQALKQANGGRDLVADGDKDGVSLVISTGAYPKNSDLNLVSENPIYFRIEDFVAYYRGELVADSLGRLTYKSTGKVVTGWEETAQDKLTYLPASEGIKVSSKHIGTPLLADMVARLVSNVSYLTVDSTSWIDRDNEWIDGVKIYYPIDNLQPRLKLVGDTHHIKSGWEEDTGELPDGIRENVPVFKWYYAPWAGKDGGEPTLVNDAGLSIADFELIKQRKSQGLGLTQTELMGIFNGQSRANFWNSKENKWSFMQSLYAWPVINNDRFWSNESDFKPQQFITPTKLNSEWKRYILPIFLIWVNWQFLIIQIFYNTDKVKRVWELIAKETHI